VALGGGTPMIEAAQQRLQDESQAGRAWLIYLSCPASDLRRRLERNLGDRPSLTGAGSLDELEEVLRAREPTYRRLADVIVQAAPRTPGEIAAQLAEDIDKTW